MIFFSIPSVGQLKPSTLFGEDDHFGFIQSLYGEEYHRAEVNEKCSVYYDKDNLRYWDSIITIFNFLGIKKLNSDNSFDRIPLLEYISDEYDNHNTKPSEILFDYLLSQWQYPHPIVTHNDQKYIKNLDLIINNQRLDFPFVKPYQVLLSILKELYLISPDASYFSNSEFYWIGYQFYKGSGKTFNLDSSKIWAEDIVKLRKNGGWEIYKTLEKGPHLSYPKGFLKNSSVLSDNPLNYVETNDLFLGLVQSENILETIDSIIENSNDVFEFDRTVSERNRELAFNYSNYLYDHERINNWLQKVDIHLDQKDIFKTVHIETKEFKSEEFELFKIANQLKRLASLDRETISRRRTEQYILRNYLTKSKDSCQCAICQKDYPIKFLATAHIKKRKDCSEEEKRDLNIVMPACHFGCDKIYEEGYIYIKDGYIHSNLENKNTTEPLTDYILNLEDKKCNYFKKETAHYFKYHAKQNI
ncbi:hypothetical protein [Chryseobacterium sp. 3008163]|uniref:hypothetical protein n=1 Tax=Chryseobacterium sp. 3008163 TaxID=2478663 RepID=UPI000F0C7A3F|nr:hypothetical protein [Chryseobacterium sp. 3008163]AYM99379.1 hypothetical protein EAG08_02645 [Chryseobacterium sp. 3008163]